MRSLVSIVAAAALFVATPALAECSLFNGSTMKVEGITAAQWRTDYPADFDDTAARPWEAIDFATHPEDYMKAVLDTARSSFRTSKRKLIGTGSEEWWASLWLDYTTSGREPYMGLTKERGPDPGDLSPSSAGDYQVWAVGFYNAAGATILGEVFADPCNAVIAEGLTFPAGTISIKFLFTDADPHVVPYLRMAPEYDALIDLPGVPRPQVADRVKRTVRLIQVDIAIKDTDAVSDWVFGTFGWIGPTKGDGLFDNLVPVSLQWGNDAATYNQSGIAQSWINPSLAGVMYGWAERPTLGFMGRANGPADNIRSSCLSCHAAARAPRSPNGILNNGFDMADLGDAAKVKAHVDLWFQDVPSGTVFDPPPIGSPRKIYPLDYSLQLDAALWRMCRACDTGNLSGPTPGICIEVGHFTEQQCTTLEPSNTPQILRNLELQSEIPPRQ